jgi:hypothetical protein
MKLLLIVQQHKRTIFDRLQESIARHAGECDIHRLDEVDQKNLRSYFERHIDTTKYDRILLMIRLKHQLTQVGFLQSLPNLVFLEIDAWQNFHPKSKYKNKFLQHYLKMPWARIVSTGYNVSEKLKEAGLDVAFVPKGYDQALIENLNTSREIELGFVGSLKSGFYSDRRNFLLKLAKVEPLQIMRTKPGREYVERLNQIRFFISADVNFGEYMIKNFEAMAAGCMLFAFDQGDEENKAIGLEDMANVVLYKTNDELRAKLTKLRAEPQLADQIAANGQRFAEQYCTFEIWGKRVVGAMHTPLRDKTMFPPSKPSLLDIFRNGFSR